VVSVFYLNKFTHILDQNLPDFDDDAYSPVIDYSLATRAIDEDLSADVTVCGMGVPAINDYLRDTWLSVAALTNLPSDKLSICMAEIKTQWLHGMNSHYHIRFGPPTVKALCEHEVVMYYNIEELTIYESAEFSVELQTLRDFSIAFVVNVIEDKTESGSATFKLDIDSKWKFPLRGVFEALNLRSAARYCRHLSIFKSLSHEIIKKYIKSIVEFVETTYLEIIVEYVIFIPDPLVPSTKVGSRYDLTVIYVDDKFNLPPSPTPNCGFGYLPEPDHHHGHGGAVVTVIEEDVLQSFEQVLTITEETVNIIFKTLWATAKKSTHVDVLCKWSVEKQFTATFDQPRIQLLSGGKALIWITLSSGSLHVEGHSETSVAGWRFAFEVNLKQVKHSELHVEKSWFGRFKDALFGKTQEESTTIEHVVLDFDSECF
jgi:hypothetical protein